jgi:hypothetical protein
MRRIASIALAVVGLTVTGLPGLADDQSISYATGMIGRAPARAYDPQAWTTWWPHGALQRAAPSSYDAYAQYDDYAQSGVYAQKSCTYPGGPKVGNSWTCQ